MVVLAVNTKQLHRYLSSSSQVCQPWCEKNRPFPSYFLHESSCETIYMKMSFTCRPFSCKLKPFSFEWFRTRIRFENEAKGNSEIAYLTSSIMFVVTWLHFWIISPHLNLLNQWPSSPRVSRSSVVRAPNQYLGGHGFDPRRRLRALSICQNWPDRSGGFECEMGLFREIFPQIHHNIV